MWSIIQTPFSLDCINRLTPKEKLEVKAKIAAFDFAEFDKQLSTSLCQLHQSVYNSSSLVSSVGWQYANLKI